MILFTILLVLSIVFAVITQVSAIVARASFFVVYGDIIVFGLIIWLIIKIIRRKKG